MASHAGVAMRNEKTVCTHSYAGITRIRFEGPGGYTPISAGMRQHPLDYDKILSCPAIFVKI